MEGDIRRTAKMTSRATRWVSPSPPRRFAISRRWTWTSGAAALLPLLAGCATGSAPSLILFGAYFPGWMFCAVGGIFAAVGARLAMVTLNLSNVLPYQLFICVAAGLIAAVGLWLLWFGR